MLRVLFLFFCLTKLPKKKYKNNILHLFIQEKKKTKYQYKMIKKKINFKKFFKIKIYEKQTKNTNKQQCDVI